MSAAIPTRAQRLARLRELEESCARDRREWIAHRRLAGSDALPKSLDLLSLAGPRVPRIVRYGIAGFSFARKLWSRPRPP